MSLPLSSWSVRQPILPNIHAGFSDGAARPDNTRNLVLLTYRKEKLRTERMDLVIG